MKRLSRYIYHFVTAALTCAVMASCADRMPEMPGASDATREYFFVLDDGRGNDTRASITSDLTTVADEGDILGAFNLGNPSDPKNVQYAVRNVADRQVLVPAVEGTELTKQTTDYLFYYPYDPEMTLEKARQLDHQVSDNQFEQENFEASDLLWDVATATTDKCTVALDHAMASITIVVQIEDNDFFDKVKLLDQPVSASGLDLTSKGIESMDYDVDAGNVVKEITAFYAPYSENGDHYRVVVPANRTIPASTKLIRYMSKRDGEKTFTLKQDLELKPGYNYVFTLLRKNNPTPDVGDDDSWVLDVKDPDTGQTVGLLCREYLRWNQNDNEKYDDPTNPNSTRGVVVNSQAWVFYNLQADGKTPDLSTGTVLRFTKDVRKNLGGGVRDDICDGKQSGYGWPAPHSYYDPSNWGSYGFGMFLADHGHQWRVVDGYGQSSPEWTEYYMHGASITWNGKENRLSGFLMPEKKVTNKEAREYGHVAIPKDGSAPFVSYEPYRENGNIDNDGHKVGYTLPHCLIDVRRNHNGDMERRAYPLVKIGFNQFWMSKSFRGKTLTDGTPLTNYNVVNKPGEFNINVIRLDWNNKITPERGYIYPLMSGSSHDDSADPFTEYQGRLEELDHVYEMPLLYNYRALIDPGLLPKSVEDVATYRLPTLTDYKYLHHYLGNQSVVKLMSNQIQTRNGNTAVESRRDAFMQGKYWLNGINTFPGNVSGFNLKVYGNYNFENGLSGTGEANFWIYPGNVDGSFSQSEHEEGMTVIAYYPWNCWDTHPMDASAFQYGKEHQFPCEHESHLMWPTGHCHNEIRRFQCYTQVRFFLEFKNQKYTTGSGPETRRTVTRSQSQSRTIHVAVDM